MALFIALASEPTSARSTAVFSPAVLRRFASCIITDHHQAELITDRLLMEQHMFLRALRNLDNAADLLGCPQRLIYPDEQLLVLQSGQLPLRIFDVAPQGALDTLRYRSLFQFRPLRNAQAPNIRRGRHKHEEHRE